MVRVACLVGHVSGLAATRSGWRRHRGATETAVQAARGEQRLGAQPRPGPRLDCHPPARPRPPPAAPQGGGGGRRPGGPLGAAAAPRGRAAAQEAVALVGGPGAAHGLAGVRLAGVRCRVCARLPGSGWRWCGHAWEHAPRRAPTRAHARAPPLPRAPRRSWLASHGAERTLLWRVVPGRPQGLKHFTLKRRRVLAGGWPWEGAARVGGCRRADRLLFVLTSCRREPVPPCRQQPCQHPTTLPANASLPAPDAGSPRCRRTPSWAPCCRRRVPAPCACMPCCCSTVWPPPPPPPRRRLARPPGRARAQRLEASARRGRRWPTTHARPSGHAALTGSRRPRRRSLPRLRPRRQARRQARRQRLRRPPSMPPSRRGCCAPLCPATCAACWRRGGCRRASPSWLACRSWPNEWWVLPPSAMPRAGSRPRAPPAPGPSAAPAPSPCPRPSAARSAPAPRSSPRARTRCCAAGRRRCAARAGGPPRAAAAAQPPPRLDPKSPLPLRWQSRCCTWVLRRASSVGAAAAGGGAGA